MDRVSIGFAAGQSLNVRVTADALADLTKALGTGEGWYDLSADGGDVKLRLDKVVYIQAENSASSVGFGS